mmetsp:Transcript_17375/g.36648  ORF Transcript_17375/g.36648 Transcript_17375/m.36648 type:complete len:304 (-) Transcript_17375:107-1018(-)
MSSPTKRKAAKSDKKGSAAALSPRTIAYLRDWMMSPEHVEHPYPNEQEKAKILADTGITSKQLTCWFSNNRKRFWKPKMEEMGRADVVEAAMGSSLAPHVIDYLKAWMMHPNHISNPYPTEEEKSEIIAATGIEKKQLTCWFSNNRKRFWKPKMDKLRQQYGLNESDPLPAAVLATAATTAAATTTAPPPPPAQDSMIMPAPAPIPETIIGFPLETSFAPVLETPLAPVGTLPLETSLAPMGAIAPVGALPPEAASAPMASLPIDDFTADLYANIESTVNEVTFEEQTKNKRQKVSLDDVVAV